MVRLADPDPRHWPNSDATDGGFRGLSVTDLVPQPKLNVLKRKTAAHKAAVVEILSVNSIATAVAVALLR